MFRVQGLGAFFSGFGAFMLKFRVQGLGPRGGLGCKAQGLGCTVRFAR